MALSASKSQFLANICMQVDNEKKKGPQLIWARVHISEKFRSSHPEIFCKKQLFKKLYGPFLWTKFHCLKARVTSRRQFTFYLLVSRNSWYSIYPPQKDERLSRPWSHLVVLNTGPLSWESSALTTTPLLHCNH